MIKNPFTTIWKDEQSMLYLVSTLFYIYLLVQHFFIFPYADDWCYGPQYGNSIGDIIERQKTIYFEWSGRVFFHTLVHLFMNYSFILWQILNPFMITLIFYCLVSLSRTSDKALLPMPYTVLLTLGLMLLVQTTVTREVYFWLMGSVVYLWPIAIALLGIVMFLKKQEDENKGMLFKIIFYLLLFLSGWSNEQTGVIVVFIFFWFLLWEYQQKKTISKHNIIAFFVVLSGFILLVTAPGNFSRLHSGNYQVYASLSFFEKILSRLPSVFRTLFSHNISKTYLILLELVLFGYYLMYSKKTNQFLPRIIPYALFPFLLVQIMSIFNTEFSYYTDSILLNFRPIQGIPLNINGILVVIPYLFWTINIFIMLLSLYLITQQQKSPWIFSTVTGAFLAIFIMVLSPYFPNRSFIPFLIFLIAGILWLVNRVSSDWLLFGIFGLLLFVKWPVFTIMILASLLIFQFFEQNTTMRKVIPLITLLAFSLLGLANNAKGMVGYYKNARVIRFNNAQIESFKNRNGITQKTIVLKKIPMPTYGFSLPYHENKGDEWITPCFKRYYEIPETVEINWEE